MPMLRVVLKVTVGIGSPSFISRASLTFASINALLGLSTIQLIIGFPASSFFNALSLLHLYVVKPL